MLVPPALPAAAGVTVLSKDERRRFRQLQRGPRRTDPDWLAGDHPRRRGCADTARIATGAAAIASLVAGVPTGLMHVDFCGILLGTGAATSRVSVRDRPDGGRLAS